MASPTSTSAADAAAKSRIISHMNADHTRSLSLYLQHHAHLSPSRARQSPTLLDITFTSMTISVAPSSIFSLFSGSSTKTKPNPQNIYKIPISPPLTTWAEARPKVVAMDKASRRALGLSEIDLSKNSTYIPPREPIHILVFLAVTWFYLSLLLTALNILTPNTTFLAYFPLGGAAGYFWLQNRIAIPALLIHVLETAWLASKLRHFGVGEGGDTKAWWAWMGSCFVEGWGAHQRFGGVVRRAEGEKRREAVNKNGGGGH